MRWIRLIGLGLAGCCTTSEGAYVEAVQRHIAQGPSQACCHVRERSPTPECLAQAETRCAFVRGARVLSSEVSRFGHDSGAVVKVELSGPNGSGSCTMQVLNGPSDKLSIDGGSCSAH